MALLVGMVHKAGSPVSTSRSLVYMLARNAKGAFAETAYQRAGSSEMAGHYPFRTYSACCGRRTCIITTG